MAKKTNNGTLRLYRSYNFTDKDPVIDILRTEIDDSGQSYLDIHERSDVSANTMYGWFHGRTRRPQFATIAAVAAALGLSVRVGERTIVAGKGKVIKMRRRA